MNDNPQLLYQVFIRTSIDQLWDAIINPDKTKDYFYGLRVESDFEDGSNITYWGERDGEPVPVIAGEIVECDPRRTLVHTFAFSNGDRPSRVTYQIEPLGGVIKLSIAHDDFDGRTQTYETVKPGWNVPISGLKTLLETMEPLNIPSPESTEDS